MADCANCHHAFAGTPWRYNTAGLRVHTDCNEQPPPPALGTPGEAHITKPRRPTTNWGWGTKPARPRTDQVRWRQLAQEHATWSRFARTILKQRKPITPAQGAALDKMERQAHRRRAFRR